MPPTALMSPQAQNGDTQPLVIVDYAPAPLAVPPAGGVSGPVVFSSDALREQLILVLYPNGDVYIRAFAPPSRKAIHL